MMVEKGKNSGVVNGPEGGNIIPVQRSQSFKHI